MVLRIVAGSIDISPVGEIQMGCGDDPTPTAKVRDPLEANVLILRDRSKSVALISIDALYIGANLRALIDEGLADLVSPEEIFLGASHTHYAPFLDGNKPLLGGIDSEHVHDVAQRLIALTRSLLAKPGAPAAVEYAVFRTSAPVSRRQKRLVGGVEGKLKFNAVIAAPNWRATIPQNAHVLRFSTADGPIAFLWQLPCHPTSLPKGCAHSAHFPGEIRAQLRRQVGSGVPVAFFQGFSGDLRPPASGSYVGMKSCVRRVLLGPWFDAFSEAEYANWVGAMTGEVSRACKSMIPVTSSDGEWLTTARVTTELAQLAVAPSRSTAQVSWQRVSVGSIDLVGVSAEPVAAYGRLVDELSADTGRTSIPVGCIDDVFGYAPTDRMLREGGYEATGFCKHFGIVELRPGFETVMKSRLTEVFRR